MCCLQHKLCSQAKWCLMQIPFLKKLHKNKSLGLLSWVIWKKISSCWQMWIISVWIPSTLPLMRTGHFHTDYLLWVLCWVFSCLTTAAQCFCISPEFSLASLQSFSSPLCCVVENWVTLCSRKLLVVASRPHPDESSLKAQISPGNCSALPSFNNRNQSSKATSTVVVA